uniref:Uncharacterized protein n=1 Tax=Plectus sambesii TaxID=2011161 RepID=A0A914VSS0_9BILA
MINIMCVPIEQPFEFASGNDNSRPNTLFPLAGHHRRKSYSYEGGRRFMDGQPTTPQTPTKLWETTIYRAFVTKLFDTDMKQCSEAAELKKAKSSADLLDVQSDNRNSECRQTCDTTKPGSIRDKANLLDMKPWRSSSESTLVPL